MVFRYLFSLLSLLLLLAVNPYSLAAAAAVRRQRSNRTSDRWIHESSSHRNSSKNASSPEGVPGSVAELGRDRNSSENASSPERDGSPVPGSMVEIGRETGSMVIYQDAHLRGMKLFMEGVGTKVLTPFVNHGFNKLTRAETCDAFHVVHKCAKCVEAGLVRIGQCLEQDCLQPFVATNMEMLKEAQSEESELEKTEKDELKQEEAAKKDTQKHATGGHKETPEEKAEKADKTPQGKKASSAMKKSKNNLVKFHWLRNHLVANKDKAGNHTAKVEKALQDSENTAKDVAKFLDRSKAKTCKKKRYAPLCQGVDKHMEKKKDAVINEIVNPKCKIQNTMMTLEDGSKKTAITKKSFLETDATYMVEDSELSDEMDKHADAFQDCPSDTFNAFRSKLALQGSDPLHLDEYKDIFESSESLLAAQSHARPSAAAAFNNATGFVKGVGQAALYVYCAGSLPYTTTEAKYCEDNLNGLPNPQQALIESGDSTAMRVWGDGDGDGDGDENENEKEPAEGKKSHFWKKTFFALGMVGAVVAGGFIVACLAFPVTTGICAAGVGSFVLIMAMVILGCVLVAVFAVAMAAFSNL